MVAWLGSISASCSEGRTDCEVWSVAGGGKEGVGKLFVMVAFNWPYENDQNWRVH